MPWAAPRTCREPGCPQLVLEPGRYRCPRHHKDLRARLDAGRLGARARGYDAAWERVRAAFLVAHPRCQRCGAPAVDVDHVVAIDDGGPRLDPANLRALCHPCHSSRTARDQGGFGHR
jgi:5-methylcytosine-specific restriction enzyme A